MTAHAWSAEEDAALAELKHLGNTEAAKELQRQGFQPRERRAVHRRRLTLGLDYESFGGSQHGGDTTPFLQTIAADSHVTDIESSIIEIVRAGEASMTDLCNALDRGPSTIIAAVENLQQKGYRVALEHDLARIKDSTPTGLVEIPREHFQSGRRVRFGVVSDMHYCSRYERRDIVEAAYDKFEEEGIKEVIIPGNYIDGEAPFNRNDLIVAPGFERQIDYFIKHYPQREGITTRVLDGRDHEGWYSRREGIDIGKRMVQSARDVGRFDIEYLGTSEVDLAFYSNREGTGRPAVVRVVHPSGGSSYSLSYKPQKIIESYESGEKPQLLIVGHFHKSGYFTFRGCHTIMAGCAEGQTPFMRDKQLAAHTGFWILEFQVHDDGSITEFNPRWFPFWNEGFYKDKYPIGDIEATRVA